MDKKKIDDFFNKLKEISKESIILVEGKNDKKALEEFKVKNVVVMRKPIYLIIEHIVKSKKSCVILTDLDKKGKEFHSIIKAQLSNMGVYVNDEPRKFFEEIEVRQIEGISRFYKKLG